MGGFFEERAVDMEGFTSLSFQGEDFGAQGARTGV